MITLSKRSALTITALLLALSGCARVELPERPAVTLQGYPPAIHQQLETAVQRVERRPRRAGANGQLGMLLQTYDQLRDAEIYYRRAMLLDAGAFRWPYLRSWVLADLGDPQGALASLRLALNIDPDYRRARGRLAELLLATGRLDECGDVLEDLIAHQPGQPEAYFIRAQLALRRNEPQRAIGDLKKVHSLTGHFGALHHSFAQAYRLTGNGDAVERHVALAEQFSDARADIDDPVMATMLGLNISTTKRIERARAFAAHGNAVAARKILLEALADDPDSLPLHVTLAGLYGGHGDFAAADRHLERAAAIDPDHPRLHYSTGIARLAEQRFAEAEGAFRRSLDIDPDNADAWAQLGLLQEMTSRNEPAIASYRAALERDPWHRQAHWMLARQLIRSNDLDTAIEHLETVRAGRDPSSGGVLLDLGRAYHAAGRIEAATSVLREAIEAAEEFGDDRSRAGARALLRRIES